MDAEPLTSNLKMTKFKTLFIEIRILNDLNANATIIMVTDNDNSPKGSLIKEKVQLYYGSNLKLQHHWKHEKERHCLKT